MVESQINENKNENNNNITNNNINNNQVNNINNVNSNNNSQNNNYNVNSNNNSNNFEEIIIGDKENLNSIELKPISQNQTELYHYQHQHQPQQQQQDQSIISEQIKDEIVLKKKLNEQNNLNYSNQQQHQNPINISHCHNCYNRLNSSNYINNNNGSVFNPFEADRSRPYLSMDMRRRYRVSMYAFDWAFTVAAGLIGALLFYFVPVRGRLFTLTDVSISYPLVDELVPFPALMAISLFIPIIVIFLTILFHSRNWHDLHHAALGLVQTFALTLLLVAIIKCFIGGLRPNFLVRCKPTAESLANAKPVGFNQVYYSHEICTGDRADILDAMASFPSGHAGLAACGLIYLGIFLHARLKTFHNRGHLFIFVMILSCIGGAVLVGVSRIVDYRHTFLNVLLGWSIGIACALSMYRLNYLSLFGRDNHIAVAHYWLWHWNSFQSNEPQSVKVARHIHDTNTNKQSYDV